jgi:MYXO-CTERM domain-containing protein
MMDVGRSSLQRVRLGVVGPAAAVCLLSILSPGVAAAQQWVPHGAVADGVQIDAVRGVNDELHLVAAQYHRINVTGQVIATEPSGDGQQWFLDFPPALAAGDDGSVHLVTRHDGSWDEGHDIRYRRRNAAGAWDIDYVFGTRVRRNYVVGAASAGPGLVYMLTSEGGDDVWGDVHIWSEGGGQASELGSIGGVWRADADARLRGRAGRVYLASGKCDGDPSPAYFSWGDAGPNLASSLASNLQGHFGGTGRRGAPDLYIDRAGQVHFTYGANQEVYYNRYSADGQRQLGNDVRVFDGLGEWHLSFGLSAVAASDDGANVVAVGLRSDGSQDAGDSDVLWSYSSDGGQSWTAPQDTGWMTSGGEGRTRPRLVAVGSKFFLFYRDHSASAIVLATLELLPDQDQDGYTQDVDCDDANPNIKPGAEEVCGNQKDDDCDQQTDESCPDAGSQDAAVEAGDAWTEVDGGVQAEGGAYAEGGAHADGGDVPDSEAPVAEGWANDGPAEGCACRVDADRGRKGNGSDAAYALAALTLLLVRRSGCGANAAPEHRVR